ncbi:MAG: DegV family protein [Roseburia sp.]|nr:DegV family protein [Roseburia sp.]MCM1279035.1 DegV family protein [Robinsoniella sp.]
MKYKIVIDSCGDLTTELKNDERIESIPLELQVGEYRTWDDESFDQADFLKRVAACAQCAKSSCPSPERYMEAYVTEAPDVYVITLSSNLSGSYNSALLGKNLYHEKYGEKNIHVIDSCSASIGQTQIALKIMGLAEEGKSFEEVVKLAETFRDEQDTYFVLDNLETLRKNGRLSNVKALVASTLSIKPIMGSTDEGTIVQLGQTIGMKKALQKMADMIAQKIRTKIEMPKEARIMIAHCNCSDRAEHMKQLLEERVKVKEILIVDTAGISSMYANDGGIIVTV